MKKKLLQSDESTGKQMVSFQRALLTGKGKGKGKKFAGFRRGESHHRHGVYSI